MTAMPTLPEPDVPPPPPHLSAEAAAWWWEVQADYTLEPHHHRLLQICCESWDRGQAARCELEAHGGVTFTDSKGQIRSHPAVAIQRDAAILFNRTLRELGLDAGAPGERSRPPTLPDYRN
jgi:P27 family predicted phage terminase small subunit